MTFNLTLIGTRKARAGGRGITVTIPAAIARDMKLKPTDELELYRDPKKPHSLVIAVPGDDHE